ncbi:MAG: GNAT family N-acetyltransferase [Nitrososphaerales archaeon]
MSESLPSVDGIDNDGRGVTIRVASDEDVDDIAEVFARELGRPPDKQRIQKLMTEFPAAVAENGEEIVGFVYTTDFAPDILELANIVVKRGWRNRGLGHRLIELVESAAQSQFEAVILVNSMLYPIVGDKWPATRFYEAQGYEILFETSESRMFMKRLTRESE